jgi:hypothetical protein
MFPDLVFCYFAEDRIQCISNYKFHDSSVYSWLCLRIFLEFLKALKFEIFGG